MSSQQRGSKLKIKVPKVRRNMAEVVAYEDLPRLKKARQDQLLLWGTVVGLFGLVLMGGAAMWYWGRSEPHAGVTIRGGGLKSAEVLAEAREHYIQGRLKEASLQGRLALGLELANPSTPPLEKDIRRLLGLVAQQEKDYFEALTHWRWLSTHSPSPEDMTHLALCQDRVNRSLEGAALDQLQGAQTLLVSGQEQRALAEARAAIRTLEALPTGARSLQASHLLVANIALQQGNARLALMELQAARAKGPLGPKHQALLARLQSMQKPSAAPPQPMAMRAMQVQVVIPQLAGGASYPKGKPVTNMPGARPSPMAPPVETDLPEEDEESQTALTTPKRAKPKLELPRLQMPGSGKPGSSTQGGSLPSYQDQSGSSLPNYNTKSRPRDSLPGY